MICHKQDAVIIEKLRKGLSSSIRRTPNSQADALHQLVGAYLYCQSHGINYHTIWQEYYEEVKKQEV